MSWCLLTTQQLSEIQSSILHNLLTSVLASRFVTGFGIFVSAIILSRSISAPLTTITKMAQELSVGNIIRDHRDPIQDSLHAPKDEIGAISRAFDRLIEYFQACAEASAAIATKDLTITVTPHSERDELGIAFAKMLSGLQEVIERVAENAWNVSRAASQLAIISEQSGQATSQVALTMQHVATSTAHQSEDISRTSGSVEKMNSTITLMASRAQAQAVNKASSMATQLLSTLLQVTTNAQSGAAGASEAPSAALSGTRRIEATIEGMQTIKAQVGLSAKKVSEMGQRSEQIDAIVEIIDGIASQTDRLALNAAIEAARVEAKGRKTAEMILQQHMLGVANLVAEFLAAGHKISSKELEALAR